MNPLVLLLLLVTCFLTSQALPNNNDCSELLEGLVIPAAIQVPSGQKLQVAYYAKGLQHYSFNGTDWVNFNATADLYPLQAGFKIHNISTSGNGTKVDLHPLEGFTSGNGTKEVVVGQHFFLGHPDPAGGQPSWKTFLPTFSLVTARSLEAVTVDPNSITWNLLQATADSGSKDLLGAVTYLQRVASKGGLPPSTTVGAQLGEIHLTPYSIIYLFYIKAE